MIDRTTYFSNEPTIKTEFDFLLKGIHILKNKLGENVQDFLRKFCSENTVALYETIYYNFNVKIIHYS